MDNWKIDTSHSSLGFVARHMLFAKVRGHFGSWQGSFATQGEQPVAESIKVEAETASITTADAKRDEHLRSADFFDAGNQPKVTFEGKSFDGKTLSGVLSIRGVSKPVTLAVEALGRGKDPWGNERIAFSAKGTIDRHDYGLNWNAALEAGGVLVGPKVELEIEVQAVKA